MNKTNQQSQTGFTLAEVLIALALLGIVAAFTIPKLLQITSQETNNANAKEAISTVSQAYANYQKNLKGTPVPTTMKQSDLIPYINHMAVDTTSLLDDHPKRNRAYNCATDTTCLRLHSGGTLFWLKDRIWGGTTPQHALSYFWDPDGKRLQNPPESDGPSSSIAFVLYYNGAIRDREHAIPGSITTDINTGPVGTFEPEAGLNPSWFHW